MLRWSSAACTSSFLGVGYCMLGRATSLSGSVNSADEPQTPLNPHEQALSPFHMHLLACDKRFRQAQHVLHKYLQGH